MAELLYAENAVAEQYTGGVYNMHDGGCSAGIGGGKCLLRVGYGQNTSP